MSSASKFKKKNSTLSKAISDSHLAKQLISTQKVGFAARSELLDNSDSGRDLLFTIRSPPKPISLLNLQIPSLNSPVQSNSKHRINALKAKALSSETLKLSHIAPIKKNKNNLDSFKLVDEDGDATRTEKFPADDINAHAKALEKELQKALDENKRLKLRLNSSISDAYIEELMNRFKSRLCKLLYD